MREFRENMLQAVRQTLVNSYPDWLTIPQLAVLSGVGASTVKAIHERGILDKFANTQILHIKLKSGRNKLYPTFQISKRGLLDEIAKLRKLRVC